MVPSLQPFASMLRASLIALAMLAACGNPAPPVGDDDDDDAGIDSGGGGDSGLGLRWESVGVGAPVGVVTIDEVRLWVSDLRIVGDAAPGDDRTYLAHAEIGLEGGDPPTQYFADAPPGRYSTLDFDVRGPVDGEGSWRLHGTVELDDGTYELEIEDESPIAKNLALPGLVLAAGEARWIRLEVDVAAVVEGVDWESMRHDGDRIEVEEDDPELAAFHARMVTAITVAGIE